MGDTKYGKSDKTGLTEPGFQYTMNKREGHAPAGGRQIKNSLRSGEDLPVFS